MMSCNRITRAIRYVSRLAPLFLAFLIAGSSYAATYHVSHDAPDASDTNAGSESQPWKTVSRAAAAEELRPGDSVVIHSGVYREHVEVKVSGQPGNPIVFAAAPGARVVVKGSELVRGPWTRLSDHPDRVEPYPNAFGDVWKITLGEEFFTDVRFEGSYRDKSRRWVSQVFLNENRPLQRIGLDPIYKNTEYLQLATVGRIRDDMIDQSFFFDPEDQTLYVRMAGEPAWFSIEVGVRGFALTAEKIHDVTIRGLEFRQNRQPGGQWSMVSIGECERLTIENCGFYQSDFCGLGLGRSKDCVVRNCELSYNGNTGLGMGECLDCLIEACRLLFNNYRRFHAGWHSGGMKCIPRNVRCTIRNCEAAYNIASDGIWFDADNSDIRILGNVSHHNDGAGIFFEINKGGGIIADNLVYANRTRGIYVSGSQNTWVVHNTVAGNDCGIVAMPRGEDWPLENVHILNNLLVRNYVAADTITRGCDLTLFMGCAEYGPYDRTVVSNHSDFNLLADNGWTPTLRHSWNPDNTLAQWQERFQEDLHSQSLPIDFQAAGTSFRVQPRTGTDQLAPLPDAVRSLLPPLTSAGCRRVRWPEE